MITAESLRGYPGVRHGFFTREGGVSAGGYASGLILQRAIEQADKALAISPEALDALVVKAPRGKGAGTGR